MTTSPESKPERTDLSTQKLPDIPTVQEMKDWDEETVLQWIKQKNRHILKGGNLDKFNDACIIGSVFLESNVDFYTQTCHLPSGIGQALKNLANEVKKDKPQQYSGFPPQGSYGGQPQSQYPPQQSGFGGTPPPPLSQFPPYYQAGFGAPQGQFPPPQGGFGGPPLPVLGYGAPLMALSSPGYDPHAAALGDVSRDADALRGAMKGVATDESVLSKQTAGIKREGDEVDEPDPSISPKKIRQEIVKADDDLLKRVKRAVKRRACILQKIKTISQFPDAAVQLSNAAVQLSNPAIQIKLPFPFVGYSIPERFNYDGDHDYWYYMGREKFTELLDAINVLQTTNWHGYMFYGTAGYGKSHLLAALACYLISAGKRVVYIPDCRECAWRPVTYFRAAMLLTWGGPDDGVIRERIMALNTTEAISSFFGRQSNILFLVDQINTLERDPSGTDDLSDERKSTIYGWIMKCVANHNYIFSASTNNRNRGRLTQKQTGARQLLVYGGFSAPEMQQWWNRNEELIPQGYSKDEAKAFKSRVEDLTGSIPLLLKECVVKGKIDLSAKVLEDVTTQVQRFMTRVKEDANTTDANWNTHCEYVRACISSWYVMKDTQSNLIDHRYFFAKDSSWVGEYTCGIAREAAAKQLRRYKADKFGDTDFLVALNYYISNSSVIGFFIEQAVLSSIASRGLEISEQISKKMDTIMFSGDVPRFNKTEGDPVLYCPMGFNYPGIDGIITRFTGEKCFLYPLWITVAKSYSDSESVFFRKWSMWANELDDFEVELAFIWITEADSEVNTVNEEYRWTRSERKLVHPSYRRLKIPLESVNPDISECYQRALEKLQDDEYMGDSQASLDASETEGVEESEGAEEPEGSVMNSQPAIAGEAPEYCCE